MILYKAYKTLENGQVIKFTISFNKDSRNWATSQPIEKGYRVSAVPVKLRPASNPNFQIEESGAFTGFNDTLLPIDRQSAKRLQSAIDILETRTERYLDWFRIKLSLMTEDEYLAKHRPVATAA